MKTLVLTVMLLTSTFGAAQQKPAPAQKETAPKSVAVSADTVAKQPAAKPYAIDLTRRGTVYSFGEGTDYSRIRVRTSKGTFTLAELLQKTGKKITGAVRIAQTRDLRAARVGGVRRPGRGLNFDCGTTACACTGDDDCNDLFESGKCGPIAVCYPDGCVCLRL